jgi:hypothetical protein
LVLVLPELVLDLEDVEMLVVEVVLFLRLVEQ